MLNIMLIGEIFEGQNLITMQKTRTRHIFQVHITTECCKLLSVYNELNQLIYSSNNNNKGRVGERGEGFTIQ